jgi:deazaflavin-dependent oxidoreductase (nitroreductase family)
LTRLVTPADRILHGASKGKASITGGLIAMPTFVLSTMGAKTGQVRTTPLSAIPLGDGLALIGSNAGSGKLPGWVHNLRANPAATVSYQGQTVAVLAREATEDEYEDVFDAAVRIYPGYAGYRQRATHHIPVFVLEAKDGT